MKKIKDMNNMKNNLKAAKQMLSGGVKQNAGKIAKAANKAAAFSAVFGGGLEAVKSGLEVSKGEKKVQNAVVDTTKEAAFSYVSTGVSHVADATVTIALTSTPVAPVAKLVGTASGIAVGCGADKVLHVADKTVCEKYRLAKERKEKIAAAEREAENRRYGRYIGSLKVYKKRIKW